MIRREAGAPNAPSLPATERFLCAPTGPYRGTGTGRRRRALLNLPRDDARRV
ncbi:hypothetical protein HNQ78_001110 [Phycisphaera mikurensis]|nr:hypothetical protein [Phycisphaera mikurensis]